MLRISVLASLLLFCLTATAQAKTGYVRDQIHVNMRTGPGNQFRIVRMLESGNALQIRQEKENWIQVGAPGGKGKGGWIPKRFLTEKLPAVVLLPQVQEKLARAEKSVEDLRNRLAAQEKNIQELETLRQRNEFLEARTSELSFADTWRKWATGAVIAGIFLIFGHLYSPRGAGQRTRKIRL